MAEALQTSRGMPVRVVNGFTMLVHRLSNDQQRVSWRCSKYKTCPARGTSEGLQADIRMTSGAPTDSRHNHLANPASPVKLERTTKLKSAAQANRATPSSGIAEEAQSLLDAETLQQMPSLRALQATVNRVQKIPNAMEADKKPEELKIPEELKKTLRGEQFLLKDSRVTEPEEKPYFAFASPTGIQMLKDYDEWSIDGTFFSCPKHFDQLVTINVIVGKSSLPAVWLLLPDRYQATYRRALSIFDLEELSDAKPKAFICDFEKGLQNAMEDRFPEADAVLCNFHLSQSCFKNIQKKHLLPLYDEKTHRPILRCFPSLAFLPVDEVVDGYNELCEVLGRLILGGAISEEYRAKLDDFADYFANTYIGRKEGNRYIRGRYSVESWNCFARTLAGSARTNNAIEGWHASINRRFTKGNMVFSQFLIRMQHEEEKTHNLWLKVRMNPAEPTRGRRTDDDKREQNLRALIQKYENTAKDQRNRLEHLLLVQLHLSPTAFARLMEEQEKENRQASQQSVNEDDPASQQSGSGVRSLSQGSNTSAGPAGPIRGKSLASPSTSRKLKGFDFGLSDDEVDIMN